MGLLICRTVEEPWGVVETHSGGTSPWALVLIGVASSSPQWFLCWMARVCSIFLPWDGDVEGLAAHDPERIAEKEKVLGGGL